MRHSEDFDVVKALDGLSTRIDGFERTAQDKAIFSCPLCNDKKRRGAVYPFNGTHFSSCWNCKRSLPIAEFTRQIAPELHRQLVFDNFGKAPTKINSDRIEKPAIVLKSNIVGTPVGILPDGHVARRYLADRKINDVEPFSYVRRASAVFENTMDAEAVFVRISCGYVLRYLDPEIGLRYQTLRTDHDTPKFWMPRIVPTGPIFTTEGIFDACTFRNSCAALDSALYRIAERTGLPIERFVLCFDDEPLNADVMDQKVRAIEMGYSVVFFPRGLGAKDLNDALKVGMTVREIRDRMVILDGMAAMLQHADEMRKKRKKS